MVSSRRDFLKGGLLSSVSLYLDRPASALPLHSSPAEALPGAYYRRLAYWIGAVEERLHDEPQASLASLEARKGWYHLPYMILPAAILYTRRNPSNPLYRNPRMFQLALQIGDFLVREDKLGTFAPRLDSYRDTCLWIEAYGLLKAELAPDTRAAWSSAIERNVALLEPELRSWKDEPSYTENFLGTSPNHFAWWAATVLVAGVHLGRPAWIQLASSVLRRFATTEQNPDGYWGEHNPDGPTGGYNYLTTLAVGVYWEHTHDPAALKALRAATDFHSHCTHSDGNLIDLFNDRNRYWEISPWGQFAFSHFPDGRGYAELLTRNIPNDVVDLDTLGLLAHNALYYHPGLASTPPPLQSHYVHRLHSPAGTRKSGPWTASLSGIVDTPLPRSQWFLDRQANLAVFHDRAGLIISGAHSKHQPELATFSEKIEGSWISTPKGGRLTQSENGDTLAIAYNSFSARIQLPPATSDELEVHFAFDGRGPAAQEAYLGLQLPLHLESRLTTSGGTDIVISDKAVKLDATAIGNELHHNGWSLSIDSDASLIWPIYPYNPYRNGQETNIDHAVALLRVPLNLKYTGHPWLRVGERTIRLRLRVAQQG